MIAGFSGFGLSARVSFSNRRQPAVSAAESKCIDRLALKYDRVVARLLELPQSLIHGDFFASNILFDGSRSPPRIAPLDWELAAIGPCGLDLAALVAGRWNDDERRSMALAYFENSTFQRRHRRGGKRLLDLP